MQKQPENVLKKKNWGADMTFPISKHIAMLYLFRISGAGTGVE